jgi:hypothetical protein
MATAALIQPGLFLTTFVLHIKSAWAGCRIGTLALIFHFLWIKKAAPEKPGAAVYLICGHLHQLEQNRDTYVSGGQIVRKILIGKAFHKDQPVSADFDISQVQVGMNPPVEAE